MTAAYIATNIHGDYLGDGDLIPFCSDECRDDYASDNNWSDDYYIPGDEHDSNEYCAACGVVLPGMTPDDGGRPCEHQRENVVVNRFLSEDGETCECGNWIQLPASILTVG